MDPAVYPATTTPTQSHPVFVPVDGKTVFLFCALLILANLVWLGLWLHKGVRFEERE